MFIISVKTSKQKILVLSLMCTFVLIVCTLLFNMDRNGSVYVMSSSNFSTKAVDNNSRRQFLSSFGWETSNEPLEIREIIIPEKFSNTYQKYNDIQKEQGFNLEKYKGRTCKQFKYKVLNYQSDSDSVVANLIVYKNKVIGGDISSTELSGFMHGFKSPCECKATNAKVDWEPGPNIAKSNNVNRTTYKRDVDPHDILQSAPMD